MRPAFEDPTPLRERNGETGPLDQACHQLRAVVRSCDAYEESPRGHAATLWAVRERVAARRAGRARRLRLAVGSGAALACCAAFAALALRAGPAPTGAGAPSGQEGQAVAPKAAPGSAALGSGSGSGRGEGPRAAGTWTRIDIGEIGTIEASPLADVHVEDLGAGYEIHVRVGMVRAQVARQDPFHPLVIVTQHLNVVVVGTRFDVRTDAARTLVEVLQGAVQVETAAASTLLLAGDSISSEDPRLARAPAAPEQRPVAQQPAAAKRSSRHAVAAPALSMAACEMAASAELQRRCLERLAAGDDLAAQTAFLRLASPATDSPAEALAALERLRRYAVRFPDGVFAADAALREIELLTALGRTEKVAAAAEQFQRRFPSDPRAAEVALARASALCRLPGRHSEVGRVLQTLGDDVSPEVVKAARILRDRCARPDARNGPPLPAPGASPPGPSD